MHLTDAASFSTSRPTDLYHTHLGVAIPQRLLVNLPKPLMLLLSLTQLVQQFLLRVDRHSKILDLDIERQQPLPPPPLLLLGQLAGDCRAFFCNNLLLLVLVLRVEGFLNQTFALPTIYTYVYHVYAFARARTHTYTHKPKASLSFKSIQPRNVPVSPPSQNTLKICEIDFFQVLQHHTRTSSSGIASDSSSSS